MLHHSNGRNFKQLTVIDISLRASALVVGCRTCMIIWSSGCQTLLSGIWTLVFVLLVRTWSLFCRFVLIEGIFPEGIYFPCLQALLFVFWSFVPSLLKIELGSGQVGAANVLFSVSLRIFRDIFSQAFQKEKFYRP